MGDWDGDTPAREIETWENSDPKSCYTPAVAGPPPSAVAEHTFITFDLANRASEPIASLDIPRLVAAAVPLFLAAALSCFPFFLVAAAPFCVDGAALRGDSG